MVYITNPGPGYPVLSRSWLGTGTGPRFHGMGWDGTTFSWDGTGRDHTSMGWDGMGYPTGPTFMGWDQIFIDGTGWDQTSVGWELPSQDLAWDGTGWE